LKIDFFCAADDFFFKMMSGDVLVISTSDELLVDVRRSKIDFFSCLSDCILAIIARLFAVVPAGIEILYFPSCSGRTLLAFWVTAEKVHVIRRNSQGFHVNSHEEVTDDLGESEADSVNLAFEMRFLSHTTLLCFKILMTSPTASMLIAFRYSFVRSGSISTNFKHKNSGKIHKKFVFTFVDSVFLENIFIYNTELATDSSLLKKLPPRKHLVDYF
jgi:hypothetical protein